MGKDEPENEESAEGQWRVMHSLPLPVAVVDSEGKIIFANQAWLRAPFGKRTDASPEGKRYLRLCGHHPLLPEVGDVADGLAAVLDGVRPRFEVEYPARQPGRAPECYRLSITSLSGKKGALLTHTRLGPMEPGVFRAEPTLSDNLLNETTDAVFLCDTSGRLAMANNVTGAWFGCEVGELVGTLASRIVPAELGRLLLEQNAACLETGEPRNFELTCSTSRGQRTFLLTKGVHRSRGGRLKGVFGIARDISAIKAMEREIIDMSDKEKQRLGQELHENLCQYLVGISLLGNVLHEDLLKLRLKQADDARQITRLVKESITEVRALVKGLSPMPVEQEEGLLTAFQELTEQARSIGRIRCTLQFPRNAELLDATTSIHLIRIAQEAVHNAIKHSQASRLRIRLSDQRRAIILTVEDNGVGFSPDHPSRSGFGLGLGLHIMQYRSRAIGGELEITNLEPRGTRVRCTVPKPPVKKAPARPRRLAAA